MSEKLVLIDGHSILNRAFYGVPDLTNAEGLHTNAIYGFLNILFKILDEEHADYLTVAFDVKAPTFRHEMFKEYKGTRKPMPTELHEQVPVLKELLEAMGITVVEKAGYEADDLLGTLARRAESSGCVVSIISGDRDLLQLATDKIKIRIPKTRRGTTEIEDYNEKEVMEKYTVTPTEFIDVKALMGDASDNIPGIPGVGEKTAVKIIAEYKSIENAYAHVEDIKPNKAKSSLQEHYEQAQLSKTLAAIKTDCPIEHDLESARLGEVFTPESYKIFQRLGFKNYLSRFEEGDREENKVEDNFKKITDLSEVETVLEKAAAAKEAGIYIAAEKGQFLGAALAFGDAEVYYLEVSGFVTADYLQEKINGLAAQLDAVAALDYKQALKWIKVEDKKKAFDGVLAAYLVNPLKNDYTYEDIAGEYLGIMVPSRSELLGKTPLDQAAAEKEKEFLTFVCYQAYIAFAGREKLTAKLKELEMYTLFEELEMPLMFTLFDMEQIGIKAEAEALREYGAELAVRIEQLEKDIYEMAGEEFNINSPKQLGVILFDHMGLPNGKKTKTGYSTAADVLERLAPEYPIVSSILEYRQLTKLKSTYADGLAGCIDEDGRIRSTFNQTITATGRISSTDPNLQNIPVRMELGRLIRKVFVPEEGFIFLDADYSQIELRVLAHLSGDEALIQAYKEAQDIHQITASQVFHTPFDEVTSLQRRNAKAVNFGIVYGISSFGLSQDLSISRKEASEYIERYFATYPGVKNYLDGLIKKAKEEGYVTTMFHRRRPVPELASSNFMQRSFGERVAMNSPIQGTAADIIKIAMVRVQNRLREEGMKTRLVLQVHDELLLETALDEVEKAKEILETEMKNAAQLHVALEVDMHTGKTWYEAK